MSWYTDTQLFIYDGLFVYRITKEFGCPISGNDFLAGELLNFSKHLSLGINRESDYDAFKSSLSKDIRHSKAINSQGSVLQYIDGVWTWSREELDSPFYNLPKQESVTELLAENQALKKKVSELEAKISSLQDEAKSNKNEKQAMDKRLSDFQGENSVEEPWISGRTVPGNWVPFEELDVQIFSKITPLTVTKAEGATKFLEDKTTNIQTSHFYTGVYPIVLVNVKELIPNREEARFDPYVWSLYNNAGISYAARKPFASEMSVDDARKTS